MMASPETDAGEIERERDCYECLRVLAVGAHTPTTRDWTGLVCRGVGWEERRSEVEDGWVCAAVWRDTGREIKDSSLPLTNPPVAHLTAPSLLREVDGDIILIHHGCFPWRCLCMSVFVETCTHESV